MKDWITSRDADDYFERLEEERAGYDGTDGDYNCMTSISGPHGEVDEDGHCVNCGVKIEKV